MKHFLPFLLLICVQTYSFSQSCGGDTRRGATSGHLDPNADGFITANGLGFTDCAFGYVNEMTEFEDLRNPSGCNSCQKAWTMIPIGEETTGDLWAGGASCGNTEIVPDDPNGAYAYYSIIDPDGICGSNDELLVFRVRVDASANGSFSYSLLIDTDALTGAADPDGIICQSKVANAGFEYEIIANPSNQGGIEVRNIDGVAGQYGTDIAHSNSIPTASYSRNTHYNQAHACRSICSAGNCGGDAVYHTFVIELSAIGKSCSDLDFKFAGSTASSGNGTVSSNTSIADLGGFSEAASCPDTTIACNCCEECSDPSSAYFCGSSSNDISICLMGCLTSCIAEDNSSATFAIDLLSFGGYLENGSVVLEWEVAAEENNDYYEVERSTDGINFYSINRLEGAGTTDQHLTYEMVDNAPFAGINYYRLKYVDVFGTLEYSTVIAISNNLEQPTTLEVFPTRFKQLLNVNINTAIGGEWLLQVVNMYGQPVYEEIWQMEAGFSFRQLTLNGLAAGNYILSFKSKSSGIQLNKRIVKQ